MNDVAMVKDGVNFLKFYLVSGFSDKPICPRRVSF